MPVKFQKYKQRIDAYILEYLTAKTSDFVPHNPWQKDVYTRLCEFVVSGKTIRGGLVLWCEEAFGEDKSDDYLRLAASIELIHAGLLIHDDIMDRDETRRGDKTLYVQYKDISGTNASFGDSMAMCAGDLAFFSGFELLGRLETQKKIIVDLSREFALVCVAQMQDVSFANASEIPTPEEVLSMYTYKTARYTFSFPLRSGVMLSGGDDAVINQVDALGETLGLLFQLTDDQLNLYGDPKISGKPKGSDLREHKKTLAYVSLMNAMSQTELATLQSLVNADEQVNYLYELLESHDIRHEIEIKIQELKNSAFTQIDTLPFSTEHKKDLRDIGTFLYNRTI